MARSPLYQEDYKPSFSGHETFPLRYGWLKKAFDAVKEAQSLPNNKSIFLDEAAIGRLGVGKNMVSSMRHWATCCAIIEDEDGGRIIPTHTGKFLFGENGIDPYLEYTTSLWLIHWLLCSNPNKTTWYWLFNHFTSATFKREDLVDGLLSFAESRGWKKISDTTIQRDVECLVRMYESKALNGSSVAEDGLESPLSELSLLRGVKNQFSLVRGIKPTLPSGVFAMALNDFWKDHNTSSTLSFEALAHMPGSPGRIFLLDEIDLAERVLKLEHSTNGVFSWSETAGLKQVIRERSLDQSEVITLLKADYKIR